MTTKAIEALRRIADPRNKHFAGDAQVVARAALAELEAEQAQAVACAFEGVAYMRAEVDDEVWQQSPKLYAHPSRDARDAERYRKLRFHARAASGNAIPHFKGLVFGLGATALEMLDSGVDALTPPPAAMAAKQESKHG